MVSERFVLRPSCVCDVCAASPCAFVVARGLTMWLAFACRGFQVGRGFQALSGAPAVIFAKFSDLSNRENSQEFAVWSWSSCELLTHNAWNAGHCVVCVMSGQTSDVWECWLPWFFGWTIVSANRKFRHGQCARAGWSVTRQGRASPVSVRPNEVGLDVNACLKQAERRSPPFSVPHLQQGWIANLDGLICQARIFNPATVCPKS